VEEWQYDIKMSDIGLLLMVKASTHSLFRFKFPLTVIARKKKQEQRQESESGACQSQNVILGHFSLRMMEWFVSLLILEICYFSDKNLPRDSQ